MLKKRILASSMASVMALTSICTVANAARPDQDPTNPGYDNEAFAKKDAAALKAYMESNYIKERLEANDYGTIRTANFMKAYNYATYVLDNGSSAAVDETTAAYRELAAAAGKMTHTELKDLIELKNKKEEEIKGGNKLKDGLEYDLNWTDASYTNQRKAVDEAQDVIDNKSDDRIAIDDAYDKLEACNLVLMDTVTDDEFHAIVKKCYALLGERNKYDAWTRVNVKNNVAGFNGTYSYGYYMWAMEKIYNELDKVFTEFNGLAIKKTSNIKYVNSFKDFVTLLECLDSCVNGNEAEKLVQGYKKTAYAGDVDNLINNVYHNRLAFNYTTIGISSNTDKWDGITAADNEATDIIDTVGGVAGTFNPSYNGYAAGDETEALLKSLKEVITDGATDIAADGSVGLKLEYNVKAANFNSSGSKAAEEWKEVDESVAEKNPVLREMWSLNWGTDGKLGKAELELKVTADDNKKGSFMALENNKTKKWVAFADNTYAKNNPTGTNSGYTWVPVQYGAPFNLSDHIDVTQAIILNTTDPDSTSTFGQIKAPMNSDELVSGATSVLSTRDTNVGNGVRDGAAADTDWFIGVSGTTDNGTKIAINNPFNSFDFFSTSSGLLWGGLANGGLTSNVASVVDNSTHGVNWSGKQTSLGTIVDADMAIELAGLYLNGKYTYCAGDAHNGVTALSTVNDETTLVVKVSNGANPAVIANEKAYLDVDIDTNGDFITRKYQTLADDSTVAHYTHGENNATQYEWANVYNYVNYALQDVYGNTSNDSSANVKAHTRKDVKSLLDEQEENLRWLLDQTKSEKIFSTEWDAAYRAANDADKWYGKSLTNHAWKDNTNNIDISGAQIDNPEYFNVDIDGTITGLCGGVAGNDGNADLSHTTKFMNSDEMYHGLKKAYDDLYNIWSKFKVTYGQIANDIIACEVDYKNNPSEDYKKAIMRCALALSNVEAPTSGRYVGPDFEAFDVYRKFYPNNRVNNITDSGDPNKQSDSQAELLAAWNAMLKAKDGDTTDEPIECKLRGDADDNGSVTAADATTILKYLVGSAELTADGEKNAAAADGKTGITAADATAVLKYLVNEKWD